MYLDEETFFAMTSTTVVNLCTLLFSGVDVLHDTLNTAYSQFSCGKKDGETNVHQIGVEKPEVPG